MANATQKFNDRAGPSKAVINRFMNAAHGDNLAAVKRAVKKYPDAVNWRDRTGNTALHYAAGAGATKTAAFLLDQGADIEARNVDDGMWGGVTPLIVAAEWERNLETVQLLADRGANLNAQTGAGESALMRAAWYSMYNVNKDQGNQVLRTLVARGADVTMRNKSGKAALDIALNGGAEPEAANAIREAVVEREARVTAQAADEKLRREDAIQGAFTKGLDQPAKILPPVQLKKNRPYPRR